MRRRSRSNPNNVSIHAPSRERHILLSTIRFSIMRFQSTLPRGSDTVIVLTVRQGKRFQSTLPRGSDTYDKLYDAINHDVSIHAPSRERHMLSKILTIPSYRFQSTLPRGSDTFSIANIRRGCGFQSTLPRGSDTQ